MANISSVMHVIRFYSDFDTERLVPLTLIFFMLLQACR